MLTIDIYHQQFTEAFSALRANLADLQPVLHDVGVGLEGRVSARFETRTDPLGHAWHPWAQSTIESYPFPGTREAARMGKPGNERLLDRYGDMLVSLNSQADASNSSVRVGFGVEYATYHEWGTKHMERRGMLTANPETGELAPDDVAMVMDILQRHLFT